MLQAARFSGVRADMVKVGVIGCGAVGQMHLDNLRRHPGVEIVALSDLRPKLLGLVGAHYKVPKLFSNHINLLRDPHIDAVVVVVHRSHTAKILADCIAASKHIFTEKPLALGYYEALSLKTALGTQSQRKVFHVGYQRRADGGVRSALEIFKEAVKSQRFGGLRYVKSWNFTGMDRSPEHKAIMTSEPRPKGEVHISDRFTNVVCHDINLINAFLPGEKIVVYADVHGAKGHTVILRSRAGVPINLSCDFNEVNSPQDRYRWKEGIEFFFDKATLKLTIKAPLQHSHEALVTQHLADSVESFRISTVQPERAFQTEMNEFISDIRYGRHSLDRITEAIEDLKLIMDIFAYGV